jgi:competence protein ComEC
MANSRNKKIIFFLFGFLVLSNALAWLAVFQLKNRAKLEVNFFDVGQGDSVFIQTKAGHQVLIDGGPSSAVLEKLGQEMPFWDRTIDLVVLTHPEKDHLAGLIEVLKRYKVEHILWTGVKRDTAEYDEWLKGIEREGADVVIASSGQKIKIGKAELLIIYPLEDFKNEYLKDSNDTSIVAKLFFGKNTFLFTGDISQAAETEIVGALVDINSDVLKISHHGSKYSTSNEFIKSVSPKIAVIEVGRDNSYGHPSADVLDRLSKYGINILRTDQNGDIKIISDFNNIFFAK